MTKAHFPVWLYFDKWYYLGKSATRAWKVDVSGEGDCLVDGEPEGRTARCDLELVYSRVVEGDMKREEQRQQGGGEKGSCGGAGHHPPHTSTL